MASSDICDIMLAHTLVHEGNVQIGLCDGCLDPGVSLYIARLMTLSSKCNACNRTLSQLQFQCMLTLFICITTACCQQALTGYARTSVRDNFALRGNCTWLSRSYMAAQSFRHHNPL